MINKKYYSTDEYYSIDPPTKEKIPFTGYVEIKDGIPYSFKDGKKLEIANNYITKINLSNNFFDRLLENTLSLPFNLEDCTFGANDFLKTSVINKIISNLETNNNYILKNCFIAQNNLPIAKKIPSLSPYRNPENNMITNWAWSNISSNNIANIWDKTDWNDDVPGKNWNINDLNDSCIVPTDKIYSNELESNNKNNFFAVFLAFKDTIRLMNIYLCPDNIISDDINPEQTNINNFFNSPNDIDIINGNNNLELLAFSNIDPNNLQSVKFKNIKAISLDKDSLYVIDSELNGLFKYDISKCTSDRGVATNKITLIDYIQGLGDLNDALRFNNPSAISAKNNTIAVLDSGNTCIKVYDLYLNHKFTIRSGAFTRQKVQGVTICPYEFELDNKKINENSIWVISKAGDKISYDIYTNEGEYIGNKTVNYISLITDYWINENTGQESSSDPIKNEEELKKIEFSYNNSNYYYLITNKRIIKFQLSKLQYPIGIIFYYYRSITIDSLIWENIYQPWDSVRDMGSDLITWSYDRSRSIINLPTIKCFSLTGIDDLDKDIIFNIIDNRTYYSDGKLQRVDNYENNKLLYITNLGKYTYSQFTNGNENRPVLVNVNDKVNEFININGIPAKTDTIITIKPIEEINSKFSNTILFYEEPNILASTLLKTDINVYNEKELNFKDTNEYFNALTFNNILHKLYYNLTQVKKYIYGAFSGGYSIDNIMTFDHIEVNPNIQYIGSDTENYYIGDNELTSAMLNRCFIHIFNIQVNILKEIQTKFISSINYNLNTYKII